jgi:membrane fusion protein, multidrug efflux system
LNWVILASRFPVRIEIHERDPQYPLRMGMTAFVTVLDRQADLSGLSPSTLEAVNRAQALQSR